MWDVPFAAHVDFHQASTADGEKREDEEPSINWQAFLKVWLFRTIMAVSVMEKSYHPDQNMQGLDIAYTLAFRDQAEY